MNRAIKKWLVLITGWVFLLVGFIGLFLPVLQGVLFIVIGLVILSAEYAWAHHLLEQLKAKFPHAARHVEHAKEFIEKRLNRLRCRPHAANGTEGRSRPFQNSENSTELP